MAHLLRQQDERVYMAGAEHPKVPVVERRQFRLVQPFDDRKYGCIDEAYVRVRITAQDFPNTNEVFELEVFYEEGALSDVIEEG
jgi:hypothetical protein